MGDAFGEGFFLPEGVAEAAVRARTLPKSPWSCTDDTVMALSIVEVLEETSFIDPDLLARYFARRFARDPRRGYGGTARGILQRIDSGVHWREASVSAFDGVGSMGNGASMRVAPIGGWFEGQPTVAAHEAERSAAVTHAHPEGRAAAMAVAVAASVIHGVESPQALFAAVLGHTPEGDTKRGIAAAAELDLGGDVDGAVAALGNGTRVIGPDTVPFCLWCVARHLDSFEEALWTTVSGLGDRDTTCAIVGGILALRPAAGEIPSAWLEAREPLESLPSHD